MGKSKIKKRITLQKQFVVSYVLVLALSMATALSVLAVFYYVSYQTSGSNSLKLKDTQKIVEYAYHHGSLLMEKNKQEELNQLIQDRNLTYYIKDKADNIIFSSRKDRDGVKPESSFMKRISRFVNNALHTASINIPLVDNSTGVISYMLVITHPVNFVLVDVTIPFLCFWLFTSIFARRFSRRIKKPLAELMNAVGRIKSRDLDFSIISNEENEIGDLARAFEEMKTNFKDSLIREWQLEQDRRDMVSAITHDLRTPLAIIQGHVEGLQDGLKRDGDKLDVYLGVIEQNAQRAKGLIDEMNSLVEIDSAGFELNLCAVDFPEFIDNKTNEMKLLAGDNEIGIESEISDLREGKGPVLIDLNRISQVLDNIVGNSIRVTPRGGSIHLQVSIKEKTASFKISDTGPGFSEKDLACLFQKFYKGDPSRSREKGHSGLGLYIARSIIEKHGGGIQASNLPGGGACIEFFIAL